MRYPCANRPPELILAHPSQLVNLFPNQGNRKFAIISLKAIDSFSKMARKTLCAQVDLETAKRIDALSQLENRSLSEIASASIFLGSILPPEVWEQLWKLKTNGSQEDWEEIAHLFARSLLEHQYKKTSEKITQQFDAQWLDTLETEEDLLNAAIELTKDG
ncbi:MAG: hypothetical protein DSM107014_04205 [Gomphosphaeria aponina SAG 52.96 = DSM 107014]|uniref:Uncharacterized protein n=1 Tax=Gomphosphaeria aponina SAG 52.96 = DSM 107014 TaxID=1521640 RepID=A0A941GQB6_9CHRO|nr:hypothetical protein [Gomphosphaeria aponina SAG 52.96 = DSM 107014]